MKLVFFDLETTGTNYWQHGIHQISGMIEIDGEIKEEFDIRVQPNPKAKIDDEALEVCRITREHLIGYQPMESGYKEFVSMLDKYIDKFDKTDKAFLVGYNNSSFDNQFLRAFFVQNGDNYFGSYFWPNPVDVYTMASLMLMSRRQFMSSFKLASICTEVGLAVNSSKLHDSLYDVRLTYELYHYFMGGIDLGYIERVKGSLPDAIKAKLPEESPEEMPKDARKQTHDSKGLPKADKLKMQ